MKPTPPVININETEFEDLIQQLQNCSLSSDDRIKVVAILRTFRWIQLTLEQTRVSLHKLRELLFGKKTEKDPSLRKNRAITECREESSLEEQNSGTSLSAPEVASDRTEQDQQLDKIDPSEEYKIQPTVGHGRRSSDSWKNAVHIQHCHTCLKAGQICPSCKEGKLYIYEKPAVFARIVGHTPLGVEIHRCDRLRCNLCGALFTAALPREVQNFPTATPEANAVAAITKYQAATPFNRFEKVLRGYGVPVAHSKLYDMCAALAQDAQPIFEFLCQKAAQGELFHNDDTRVLVQSLLKENKKAQSSNTPLNRKGMFTSGIIAQCGSHRIFLYFTGRNHAGENLRMLLQKRLNGLPPPTQVSDRSSSNTALGFTVHDAACMDHLRREFYDLKDLYPKSCDYVIKELKTIYRADSIAKKKNMSPAERLSLHQAVSLPVMRRIQSWAELQLKEKKVEPNSPLAKAIKYLLKHYVPLTLFTRKQGVPIANSSCEQSLKTPIAIRKMAYFFRTTEGAWVACLLLSLIQTSTHIDECVFDYFVAIQRHATDVRAHPELWLPWNFREQLRSSSSSIT